LLQPTNCMQHVYTPAKRVQVHYEFKERAKQACDEGL